jgi:hypothetical protein
LDLIEKTKDKNLTFNLEGNQIECESKVYLLGVTIDFELNFNEHISNIFKSWRYTGHSLFIVFKTSKATVLNLLTLREGMFYLHNNSS